MYKEYAKCARPAKFVPTERPVGHLGEKDVADWLRDTIDRMITHINLLEITVDCYEKQTLGDK